MELERRLGRVQAHRGGRGVPERLHGERRHRGLAARPRRRHRVRRAESRQHHRRRALEPRDHQGVSARRRRRGARAIVAALPADAEDAPHHRRRLQHGRRPRRHPGALRRGRRVRLPDDGGRRARQRRVRTPGARHGRSLRHARPRRTSRSARCRRPSARSAATWPGRARSSSSCITRRGRSCSRRRTRRRSTATCLAALDVLESDDSLIRASVGQHALLQGRPEGARARHRPQREPDHAGHGRRRRARDAPLRPAVRARRLRAGDRLPHRGQGQGADPDDRHGHTHARRAVVRARRVRQRPRASSEWRCAS